MGCRGIFCPAPARFPDGFCPAPRPCGPPCPCPPRRACRGAGGGRPICRLRPDAPDAHVRARARLLSVLVRLDGLLPARRGGALRRDAAVLARPGERARQLGEAGLQAALRAVCAPRPARGGAPEQPRRRRVRVCGHQGGAAARRAAAALRLRAARLPAALDRPRLPQLRRTAHRPAARARRVGLRGRPARPRRPRPRLRGDDPPGVAARVAALRRVAALAEAVDGRGAAAGVSDRGGPLGLGGHRRSAPPAPQHDGPGRGARLRAVPAHGPVALPEHRARDLRGDGARGRARVLRRGRAPGGAVGARRADSARRSTPPRTSPSRSSRSPSAPRRAATCAT